MKIAASQEKHISCHPLSMFRAISAFSLKLPLNMSQSAQLLRASQIWNKNWSLFIFQVNIWKKPPYLTDKPGTKCKPVDLMNVRAEENVREGNENKAPMDFFLGEHYYI